MAEVKLCKTKGAYSTKKDVNLDFGKIRERFRVVEDTPVVMVIDEQGHIIVHKHGELVFRDLRDKDRIEEIAERIYEAGR